MPTILIPCLLTEAYTLQTKTTIDRAEKSPTSVEHPTVRAAAAIPDLLRGGDSGVADPNTEVAEQGHSEDGDHSEPQSDVDTEASSDSDREDEERPRANASGNLAALGEQALTRTIYELQDMGLRLGDLAEFMKRKSGPLSPSKHDAVPRARTAEGSQSIVNWAGGYFQHPSNVERSASGMEGLTLPWYAAMSQNFVMGFPTAGFKTYLLFWSESAMEVAAISGSFKDKVNIFLYLPKSKEIAAARSKNRGREKGTRQYWRSMGHSAAGSRIYEHTDGCNAQPIPRGLPTFRVHRHELGSNHIRWQYDQLAGQKGLMHKGHVYAPDSSSDLIDGACRVNITTILRLPD
ncbi:hypothetical protein FB451DRAFT_1163981 [Mycena latifolia]|nr:hypothetical protein FB451DRAFT_1163981 [Mycena latifolia]